MASGMVDQSENVVSSKSSFSCFFSAWCVEDAFEFGRQSTASAAFLRKTVALGTSLIEAERDLGTDRTGVIFFGPLERTV